MTCKSRYNVESSKGNNPLVLKKTKTSLFFGHIRDFFVYMQSECDDGTGNLILNRSSQKGQSAKSDGKKHKIALNCSAKPVSNKIVPFKRASQTKT